MLGPYRARACKMFKLELALFPSLSRAACKLSELKSLASWTTSIYNPSKMIMGNLVTNRIGTKLCFIINFLTISCLNLENQIIMYGRLVSSEVIVKPKNSSRAKYSSRASRLELVHEFKSRASYIQACLHKVIKVIFMFKLSLVR